MGIKWINILIPNLNTSNKKSSKKLSLGPIFFTAKMIPLKILHFPLCYLAAQRPNFSHCWGGSLTNPIKSHQEPRNEVGSHIVAKNLARFELGSLVLCVNALTNSVTLPWDIPCGIPFFFSSWILCSILQKNKSTGATNSVINANR